MTGITRKLRLVASPHPVRPACALLIPGDDARTWLTELGRWDLPGRSLRMFVVPRSAADRQPIGVLIPLPEGELPATHPAVERHGLHGTRLLLPVDAMLDPEVTEAELDNLLLQDLVLFHPRAGFVGFAAADALRVQDLIRRPEHLGSRWDGARSGNELPTRIESITSATPEEWRNEEADTMGAESPHTLPPNPAEEKLTPLRRTGEWARRRVAQALESGSNAIEGSRSRVLSPLRRWAVRLGEWSRRDIVRHERRLRSRRHREVFRLLDLLRRDPDEGLRFAVPLRGLTEPTDLTPGSAALRSRNVDFHLEDLAESRTVESWSIPAAAYEALHGHYTTLANRELGLGRYRRAAYIFWELLDDLGAAADVLEQGRCFREAAYLYRDHLGQAKPAARCFEQAGLILEAIPLYEDSREFEHAADLSARLGRKTEATRLYLRAAENLELVGELVDAARVLATKLGFEDDALALLQGGWPWSAQASRCLLESYALLGKRGRHDEAGGMIAHHREQSLPPSRRVPLAEVLASVAESYPDPGVRRRARETARDVIGRHLPEADAPDARALAHSLARLAPRDRLLARDVERYLRDRRTRVESTGRPSRRPSAGPVELGAFNLPAGYRWEGAVGGSSAFYVAGLAARTAACVRGFWNGSVQSAEWPLLGSREFPLRLAVDRSGSSAAIIFQETRSPFTIQRFAAHGECPISQEVGTPGWLGRDVVRLAYGAQRTLWAVGRERRKLRLSSHTAHGARLAIHDLPIRAEEAARVRLYPAQDGVLVAAGQQLLRLVGKGEWESHSVFDEIRSLTGFRSGGSPGLVLTFSQGGIILWGADGWRHPYPLALGLSCPVAGFTHDGALVVVSEGSGLVYDLTGRRLRLRHEFELPPDPPLAVLGTPEARRFIVITVKGYMGFFGWDA